MVTKFGEKGVVNLGKAVPLVGGFIGGTVDGIGTNIIGKTKGYLFKIGARSSTFALFLINVNFTVRDKRRPCPDINLVFFFFNKILLTILLLFLQNILKFKLRSEETISE
ncbi:hypothetical protein [Rossellomorea vietnamensis]|uniref:hypothetical protein n=1 Tax=Rossellomorea vietnamensis TaxID=218284 RepID=UPI002078FA9C|nr:hypothetical protein [Rossellomorea vietnamensis]